MLQRTNTRADVDTLAPGNWLSATKAWAAQLGKRSGLLSVALLSIAVIGAGYAFLSYRPVAVRVAGVSANVPVRVFGLGTVEARVLSKVGFEVGAAVTELNADHGDIVKEGTVLARLHATQQDAKEARAKAAVLSAEAAIK
jgi:HlyD family secretion protein